MMRVGVLTFHFAKNYGAMLQAYALSRVISSMGAECQIIDYRYPVMYRGEGRISLGEQYRVHRRWNSIILAFAKGLIRWGQAFFRRETSQAKRYKAFMEGKLPLSRRVRDRDLFRLDYDAYVCGSDQIWNERITVGLCPVYFCAFAKCKSSIKVAYAASCGKEAFPDRIKDEATRLLSNFDAIGVRETQLCDELNDNMALPSKAVHVLDPTLLICHDEWQALATQPAIAIFGGKPYLLLYLVEETAASLWVYTLARRIASKRGLDIVKIARSCDVCGDSLDGVVSVADCGPQEFLGLIRNAEFVLAGSFHGIVFSVLFHRQFYCIPHRTDRARTDSFLGMIGLSGRNASEEMDDNQCDIDFTPVDSVLNRKKEKSVAFLKNALGL